MEPDPSEIKALDDAISRFDEAHTDLIQAVRRIQRIYEINKVRLTPFKPKKVPKDQVQGFPDKTEPTGKFCPRCYSARVIDKGGGCSYCLDCKFDLGCGG